MPVQKYGKNFCTHSGISAGIGIPFFFFLFFFLALKFWLKFSYDRQGAVKHAFLYIDRSYLLEAIGKD